jgi:hypothetical protein
MGGATLLLAAEREPAIQALVTDCAYAEIVPVLQREVPLRSGLPPFITPGVLLAARAIYGIDYSAARPLTHIAALAPRPSCRRRQEHPAC